MMAHLPLRVFPPGKTIALGISSGCKVRKQPASSRALASRLEVFATRCDAAAISASKVIGFEAEFSGTELSYLRNTCALTYLSTFSWHAFFAGWADIEGIHSKHRNHAIPLGHRVGQRRSTSRSSKRKGAPTCRNDRPLSGLGGTRSRAKPRLPKRENSCARRFTMSAGPSTGSPRQ